MSMLLAGVTMFAVLHLFPAVANPARNQAAKRLGEGPYQGVFALLILTSIVVIVFGWKSATPTHVYVPPISPGPLTSALVLIAFVLFIASVRVTNFKRLLRHPQMTSVVLWGGTHPMVNGDSRSVTLFGGLTLWAILEIVFCNRRDGEWARPESASRSKDILVVVIAVIACAAFAYLHQWFFSVPVAPGL